MSNVSERIIPALRVPQLVVDHPGLARGEVHVALDDGVLHGIQSQMMQFPKLKLTKWR